MGYTFSLRRTRRLRAATHTLVARAVEGWLNGGAKSPKEAVEKRRLKELLGS
jgi:hypothetical protein